MFDRAVAEGFLRERHRALVIAAADPATLLELMAGYEASPAEPLLSPENA